MSPAEAEQCRHEDGARCEGRPSRSWHGVGGLRDAPRRPARASALVASGSPAEHLSIKAEHLRFVQHVAGHRDRFDAGLSGLVAGGLGAARTVILFGLLDWLDPLISGPELTVYGLLVGGLFGVLARALWHILARRGLSSLGFLHAGRYRLITDSEKIGELATRQLQLQD